MGRIVARMNLSREWAGAVRRYGWDRWGVACRWVRRGPAGFVIKAQENGDGAWLVAWIVRRPGIGEAWLVLSAWVDRC